LGIDGWAGYSSAITFNHHVHYSKDHLASQVYIKNDDDGNNTPFFLIPVALMLSSTYFLLPLGVFLTQIIVASASFSAHVYIDNQYHIAGSDGSLGVEVAIPGTHPTTVSLFATEPDAEAWIARHKSQVKSDAYMSPFRRSPPSEG